METTNRLTVRATVVVRRTDVAIVVEVQVVRVVIVRRSRPIGAEVADMVEKAVTVAAKTRTRVPDGRGRTEFAGEIDTLITLAIKRFSFERRP